MVEFNVDSCTHFHFINPSWMRGQVAEWNCTLRGTVETFLLMTRLNFSTTQIAWIEPHDSSDPVDRSQSKLNRLEPKSSANWDTNAK